MLEKLINFIVVLLLIGMGFLAGSITRSIQVDKDLENICKGVTNEVQR